MENVNFGLMLKNLFRVKAAPDAHFRRSACSVDDDVVVATFCIVKFAFADNGIR